MEAGLTHKQGHTSEMLSPEQPGTNPEVSVLVALHTHTYAHLYPEATGTGPPSLHAPDVLLTGGHLSTKEMHVQGA